MVNPANDNLYSPRNAVLQNQELLVNIFLFTVQTPVGQCLEKNVLRNGRMQLRDLALTCKAFKDPALNGLWAYLDSLLPLVKLLPNLQTLDNAYYFYGFIADDSPFRLYSRKVRILELKTPPMCSIPSPNGPGEPTISSHLLLYLVKELAGAPMLPALQTLTVRNHSLPMAMDFFSVLPFLCSGSLQTVSLYGGAFSNPMFTGCCFPTMSHQLRSLKVFDFKCTSKDVGASICDSILQISTLEVLSLEVPETVGILPGTLLRMVKTLKNLVALNLDVHFQHHQVTEPYFQQGATDLGLSLKLQSVTITSRAPNRFCPCIPRFLLERVTRVDMRLPRRTIVSDPEAFTAVAHTLSEIPTLKGLRISSRHTVIKNTATLLPIFERLSLRDIRIEVPFYSQEPSLSPLIQEAFKQPRRNTLRRFYLAHTPSGPAAADEGITLTCLEQVAKHAIGLETLSVILRPSFCETTPGGLKLGDWLASLRTAGSPSSSTLRVLTVYDAKDPSVAMTFEQANHLAQIIDVLFPSLVCIKPFRDEARAYWTQRWEFIENLRSVAQATRFPVT
ncbi:hypothetical protein NMY22_g9417 [Coprinellus aureogranulatus]|nr:hypothetical protein NMY22_g9417 [Coprinellus aureogranulatus]